VKATGSR